MPIYFFQKRIFHFLLLGLIEAGDAAVDIQLHTNLTNAPALGQTVQDWWVNSIWPALREMSWYNNRGVAPLNRIDFVNGLEAAHANPDIQPLIDFSETRFFNANANLAGLPTVPGLVDYLDNDFDLGYPGASTLHDLALDGPIMKHKRVWYLDRRVGFGLTLSTMDIVRQRPYLRSLLQRGTTETNDLQKIKRLSGTFCILDDGVFTRIFSGMIEPGQDVRKNTVHTIKILTCFHGFWGEKLNDLYFIPYGFDAEAEFAFKVKNIRIGKGGILFQDGVNKETESWNSKNWEQLFSKNDYVEAFVERRSKDNKQDLGDILKEQHLVNHTAHIINLRSPELGSPQNLFAFGKPGYEWVGDPLIRTYALVTNIEPIETEFFTPYLHSARRIQPEGELATDNPNTNKETLLNNKKATSFPSVHGMSGGPIVRCSFNADDIKCNFLGVLHAVNLSKRTRGEAPFIKVLVALK